MDQANIVIRTVKPLSLPIIQIETSDSKKYSANLSHFKQVRCFPQTQEDWENVSITAQGFNLTWGTRFEVCVDQIVDWSTSVETIKKQA